MRTNLLYVLATSRSEIDTDTIEKHALFLISPSDLTARTEEGESWL